MTSQTNSFSRAFGAGDVYALVPGLTPVRLGTLQDVEIDISGAAVELYGQKQFPEAVARGKGKISGKAKMGRFDVNLFNNLYYGGTVTQGAYDKSVKAEVHTAGASAPTFSPTLSSGGFRDLGLYYQTGGVQLSYSTAAAPTIGNYTVASSASGLYTVSSAEAANTGFLVDYTYVASTGNNLLVTNQLMGVQPVFELFLFEGATTFGSRNNFDMHLYSCMSTKMNFPFKNTDWMINDFEFEAFADANDNVIELGVGT